MRGPKCVSDAWRIGCIGCMRCVGSSANICGRADICVGGGTRDPGGIVGDGARVYDLVMHIVMPAHATVHPSFG